MIVYEYPLNERVRIFLRLEYLAKRLRELMLRESALDHHFALQTLFEMVEMSESRSDLKSEILKELEKYRQTTLGFRGHAGVDAAMVDGLLAEIDSCYSALNSQVGKVSADYNANEWLTSVRSRLNIAAGACEFDHPSYFDWQHRAPGMRQAELGEWATPLVPLMKSIALLLRLLRESGSPCKVMAQNGVYQQSLTQNKGYQLLRLRIDGALGLIPEISGNRLMVTVRMMRRAKDKLVHAADTDAGFDLSLCS